MEKFRYSWLTNLTDFGTFWGPSRSIHKLIFLTFSECFHSPTILSNLNYNCSNWWDMRNLQEQVKNAFCYQKMFWPFTAWINCSSDHKNFENSQPSVSNFKSFSRSLEHFFLTVGQNHFCNKIPYLNLFFFMICFYSSNNTISHHLSLCTPALFFFFLELYEDFFPPWFYRNK